VPENILRSVFTNPDDYNDMAKHLSAYRKSNAEWDKYREKIPNDLLRKWGMVLTACHENGFVDPAVDDRQIVFRQIISRNRNSDQCTLCKNSVISGSCKGRVVLNGTKKFVHC
jgi:hypothetical protein